MNETPETTLLNALKESGDTFLAISYDSADKVRKAANDLFNKTGMPAGSTTLSNGVILSKTQHGTFELRQGTSGGGKKRRSKKRSSSKKKHKKRSSSKKRASSKRKYK